MRNPRSLFGLNHQAEGTLVFLTKNPPMKIAVLKPSQVPKKREVLVKFFQTSNHFQPSFGSNHPFGSNWIIPLVRWKFPNGVLTVQPNRFLVGGWTNPFEKKDSPIGSCPQKIGLNMKKCLCWNHHLVESFPIYISIQRQLRQFFKHPSVQSSLRWPRRQASAARRTVCRDVSRFSKPGADVTNLVPSP